MNAPTNNNQIIELSDDELHRYDRQISLKSIDIDGQIRLKKANVLIVGMGGLGCIVAQFLSGAGIGEMTLIDFDTVSLSNLHRQTLFNQQSIGKNKVSEAADLLHKKNPLIKIKAIKSRFEEFASNEFISQFNVVIDCSDNLKTRESINQFCYNKQIPLISGSAIRMEGLVAVFCYKENEPCYQCLSHFFGKDSCSCVESGVIGPLVGMIGSIQALETIKLLTNNTSVLCNKVMMIDAMSLTVRHIYISKNTDCSICHE